MDKFTNEDYTSNVYRAKKPTLVTIFSQHFPKDAKDDTDLRKAMVEDELDVDARYLQTVFKDLYPGGAAEIRIKNNTTKNEINQYIKDLGSSEECKHYDTFFFVFLTYLSSDNTDRIHVDNDLCPLKDIYDKVKEVEAMRMKPKIFLIQADDISFIYPPQGGDTKKHIKIPQDADRLVIMSDIPQWFANRDSEKEKKNHSFLIKAFCESLQDNNELRPDDRLDLLSLTTKINNKVWTRIDELKTAGLGIAKVMQAPLVTSTLTKLVKFE